MSKKERPKIEDILSTEFPLEAREDRVIIMPDEVETQTKTGIHLSEAHLGKPCTGIVVEIGVHEKTKDLKLGDHVMYGRYAGTEVEWEGVQYIIVRQSDIMIRNRKKVETI